MVKILLVRHGQAAKSPTDPDPELTELGHRQARKLAQQCTGAETASLVSSPKIRARQTAQPLADRWKRPLAIEPAVTEIPSPEGVPLSERGQWIRGLLESDWDESDARQKAWREGIVSYLAGLKEDTAVFCHFMVINSVVAHIRGDARIQQFRPDYASVTELGLNGGSLEILRLGEERRSHIL